MIFKMIGAIYIKFKIIFCFPIFDYNLSENIIVFENESENKNFKYLVSTSKSWTLVFKIFWQIKLYMFQLDFNP